jgi:hypothetical protein
VQIEVAASRARFLDHPDFTDSGALEESAFRVEDWTALLH